MDFIQLITPLFIIATLVMAAVLVRNHQRRRQALAQPNPFPPSGSRSFSNIFWLPDVM